MPLDYLDYNGKPFGLSLLAKRDDDGLIIHFMIAFEATFPKRKEPAQLIEDSQGGPDTAPKDSMMWRWTDKFHSWSIFVIYQSNRLKGSNFRGHDASQYWILRVWGSCWIT